VANVLWRARRRNYGPALRVCSKALAWSPFLRQKFTLFIAKLKKDDLAALCELMKTRKVIPVIDKRYQLSTTADAIDYVEKGHARAKVVICFE
jgi:NADPH:quinone reductase-like Zn-dependent oxidoreductase